MRRLIVARHAKSSWGDADLSDHDRPLNARGRRSAPLVGLELARLGCVPDIVYSSSAVRTRETWEGMAPGVGGSPAVEFREDLYFAPPQHVLAVIAEAPASARTLMTLGHNPACATLTLSLIRQGGSRALAAFGRRFPTGAVAVFDLPIDRWSQTNRGGELIHFVRPRDLT